MRLNPFAAYRDFRRKSAYKQYLFAAVTKLLPGQGVEVPSHLDEQPKGVPPWQEGDDAVWAAAVMDLLKEHPKLQVVRTRDHLTICKRAEIEIGLTEDLKRGMRMADALPDAGDDLVDPL